MQAGSQLTEFSLTLGDCVGLALVLLPPASSLAGSDAAWPGKGVNISSPQLPTCDSLVEMKKHLSFPQSLLGFPSPLCPSLGFGTSLTLAKGLFNLRSSRI